jgi:hypothetical protein
MSDETKPAQQIIVTSTKSVGISLLLTFFFGALGMLYSTIWGAIIMILVSIIVATVTLGMGLFLVWPICMIWGAIAAASYNKKLLSQLSQ